MTAQRVCLLWTDTMLCVFVALLLPKHAAITCSSIAIWKGTHNTCKWRQQGVCSYIHTTSLSVQFWFIAQTWYLSLAIHNIYKKNMWPVLDSTVNRFGPWAETHAQKQIQVFKSVKVFHSNLYFLKIKYEYWNCNKNICVQLTSQLHSCIWVTSFNADLLWILN